MLFVLDTRKQAEDVTDITLDKQLCFAVYKASNKLGRLYAQILNSYGLTFPQYQTLLALLERAPCSVGVLCAALDLETSTVTPLLKRLESDGYIDRFRDRIDERRVIIMLTAKGQAFRKDAATIRTQIVHRIGMSLDEIVQLRKSLQGLNASIDRMGMG